MLSTRDIATSSSRALRGFQHLGSENSNTLNMVSVIYFFEIETTFIVSSKKKEEIFILEE